jgi:hypothetical protein
VTVVTGLFLLLPGYFSGLGPVDGAQTAEREKTKLRKFGRGRRGKNRVCTLRKRQIALCHNFFVEKEK